jgi:hypothetical protein
MSITIGCDLLGLLPGKVEMLDVSRAHRLELSGTLAATLTYILEQLDILVVQRGAQFSSIEACAIMTCLRVSDSFVSIDSFNSHFVNTAMEK